MLFLKGLPMRYLRSKAKARDVVLKKTEGPSFHSSYLKLSLLSEFILVQIQWEE